MPLLVYWHLISQCISTISLQHLQFLFMFLVIWHKTCTVTHLVQPPMIHYSLGTKLHTCVNTTTALLLLLFICFRNTKRHNHMWLLINCQCVLTFQELKCQTSYQSKIWSTVNKWSEFIKYFIYNNLWQMQSVSFLNIITPPFF